MQEPLYAIGLNLSHQNPRSLQLLVALSAMLVASFSRAERTEGFEGLGLSLTPAVGVGWGYGSEEDPSGNEVTYKGGPDLHHLGIGAELDYGGSEKSFVYAALVGDYRSRLLSGSYGGGALENATISSTAYTVSAGAEVGFLLHAGHDSNAISGELERWHEPYGKVGFGAGFLHTAYDLGAAATELFARSGRGFYIRGRGMYFLTQWLGLGVRVQYNGYTTERALEGNSAYTLTLDSQLLVLDF